MVVGGQRHAPAALPSGKRLGTRCIGSWVGSQGQSGRVGKISPHRGSIPGPSSSYRFAIPTELSRQFKSQLIFCLALYNSYYIPVSML
jgi:hypothetical protein